MAITKIGHTALLVRDMQKSTDFYTKVLGFKKVFDLKDDKGNPWIVYFKIGKDQFIELFYSKDEPDNDFKPRIGYQHVCYEVDDINATEKEIVKGGGALDRPIKKGLDGNFQMWVKDPDGNRIELMQIVPDSPHAKARG
ncbi:MAG TPA: VOC family protein [Spirochaetia bacterium]|nr:VOC family protein [Spirochaetia bacterium]